MLLVAAWPSNTRLYEAVADRGLAIDCRPPEKTVGKRKVLDEARICSWLGQWASTRHAIRLRPQAARLMLELVGPEFGLLDRETCQAAPVCRAGRRCCAGNGSRHRGRLEDQDNLGVA